MEEPQKENITLNDILITEKLSGRSPRPQNLQAEVQAMQILARQRLKNSATMLQSLVEIALELCQAGSAGVSLLTIGPEGEKIFRWDALAGTLAEYVGNAAPRNFSPCGVCLDRGTPQLYQHPEEYFTYLETTNTPIAEGLVLPLIAENQALGTIWIMSHDEQRHFDSEDVRVMTSLAGFTAAALILNQRQTEQLQAKNSQLEAEIVERQRAESVANEMETYFRAIANLVPDLLWCNDLKGNTFWYNQRWLDYTGQTMAEAQGYGWLEVIHPEDRSQSRTNFQRAVDKGYPLQQEHRIRDADGNYRWFLVRAEPQRDEQNQIVRWFGTATDIDNLKQAEAEREQLLQREQAARKEAEQANCVKDEFLAILSHELRTPLTLMLGWARLLQTRNLTQSQIAEALTAIERNAILQTQLIDDLLDLAKILRGKLSLQTTSVKLTSVIEEALKTVTTAATNKSISLDVSLPKIGQVSGDRARLQQIFWNLLSNAIKFTPDGGRVEISGEKIRKQAKITVKDTGKGISPDFLPHIFNSFQQEDASISRQHGGLGLGLAIARQLVEAHGGTITADSPGLGLGATFTVWLPLLNGEAESKATPESSSSELELTNIRVLAVDDDPDTRQLLTILLKEHKASVLTVASATEVLANLESFQPDILICDIGMPDVDGLMLIEQIRSLPPEKGGQIPAIALTAYVRIEDRQQALARGYQLHLSKPCEPKNLVQAIVRLTKIKHLNSQE
ncbi:ATP-binding protein [Oscillatoria salina]|uniref:ATP-binding protein n=1 Tax=Oscillatoria salina TaxID=331517 RepID=UPI001CCB5645|nr:ATP-binding protein [Oscillatoria salina]